MRTKTSYQITLLIVALSSSACQTTPEADGGHQNPAAKAAPKELTASVDKDTASQQRTLPASVERPLRPVPAFAIPSDAPRAEERGTAALQIQVVAAPDLSAREHPVHLVSENGYDPKTEPVRVELLNTWEDGGTYFTNVNFRNPGAQILKTIFIFGYDRLGRLVSTRADQTFFREKSNIVRTLTFAKNERAVRWAVIVKD